MPARPPPTNVSKPRTEAASFFQTIFNTSVRQSTTPVVPKNDNLKSSATPRLRRLKPTKLSPTPSAKRFSAQKHKVVASSRRQDTHQALVDLQPDASLKSLVPSGSRSSSSSTPKSQHTNSSSAPSSSSSSSIRHGLSARTVSSSSKRRRVMVAPDPSSMPNNIPQPSTSARNRLHHAPHSLLTPRTKSVDKETHMPLLSPPEQTETATPDAKVTKPPPAEESVWDYMFRDLTPLEKAENHIQHLKGIIGQLGKENKQVTHNLEHCVFSCHLPSLPHALCSSFSFIASFEVFVESYFWN
eukprot:m.50347 g.50347  ORF g.50347 m.50347 type:complete len:299 (+) comp18023_c0_seq2:28-924(+)